MTSAPAPSSRRLRLSDVQIDVVANSPAMQALIEDATNRMRDRRYICLTIRSGDAPELHSFCSTVAASIGLAPPRIVVSTDGSFCRPTVEKHDEREATPQGVLALRLNEFPQATMGELLRLNKRGFRFPLFVGTFTSVQAYETCKGTWSEAVSNIFDFELIQWPSLRERQLDLRELIAVIAERIISEDGRQRAELSPSGVDAICDKNLRQVADVVTHIRGAFDVMLRTPGATEITADHVRIASDPIHRRNLLGRATDASPE